MTSVLNYPHYDVEKQGLIEPFSYIEMETSTSNPRADLSLWVDANGSRLMLGDVAIGASSTAGPASSTDNAAVRFNGTSGKLVKNSIVIISDTGDIVGTRAISLSTQASNPGSTNTLWINNADGSLYVGATKVANPGNVVGAPSSTDNSAVRFDSTTGKLIKNSTVTISDTGDISGTQSLTLATQAANPGSTNTLWINNADGSLYTGAVKVGGSGSVFGPASSTDSAIVRFDSTTGKLIKNSTVTISDTGVVVFTGTVLFQIGAVPILKVDAAGNITMGKTAGGSITTGTLNTLIGENAGTAITNATANVCVGQKAGKVNISGANNTYIGTGVASLGTYTSGFDNIGIGASAFMTPGTNNYRNILLGTLVAANGAIESIVIGHLTHNTNAPRSSIIIGNYSCTVLGVGNTANVIIGTSSFAYVTSDLSETVSIGSAICSTLSTSISMPNNTFVGNKVLWKKTGGYLENNTLTGSNVFQFNTNGNFYDNVISGALVGQSSVTSGINGNVILGCNAVSAMTGNMANSIVIGLSAGSAYISGGGVSNIWIGSPGAAAESGTIRIGNTQSRCFINGVYGASEVDTNYRVAKIGTNGQIVGGDLYSTISAPVLISAVYTLIASTVSNANNITVSLIRNGRTVTMYVPGLTLTGIAVPPRYYESATGAITVAYQPATGQTFTVPILTRVNGGVNVDIMGRATLGLFGGVYRLRIEKEPDPGNGTFNGTNAGWDAFTMSYFTD